MSDQYHRGSIRLRGFDYAGSGAYFVTICTYQRERLFGRIVDRAMILNEMGRVVYDEWHMSDEIRSEIDLDEFVIMPDHIHFIVWITAPRSDAVQFQSIRKPKSLSSFVAGFKCVVTKRINAVRRSNGASIWQRNYYERIIRSDAELHALRRYIKENPRH
ncbi:MAG: transposase [Candidatus Uhrbacteria bacterium]